ncbi:DUF262 domain-containing protein [Streptosporangium sp. NPDC023615]|uniref:GmrSD restriction endonuclease domain-containing protein n=1 Tax=Streptosporangium sp. NPDC023615 TaxID=3154794 RepID=UPI003435EF13
MQVQESSVMSLIEGQQQFQVPLYQRTYKWDQKDLRLLWDDVIEHAEALASGEERSAHFLGSVVLAPGDVSAGGKKVNRWLVVDGQQRLTTLMLAFCALRDHMARLDECEADRIHRQYLVNEFKTGLDHYRLLPTQADREAFRACLDRSPTAGGPDKIGNAYRFFKAALVGLDTDADQLDRIESVLCDKLSLVVITADKADNVYRIFESLNNTGVRLTQTDLLRNYVFMLLPKHGEDVYEQHWLPLQNLLGPDNLELLVWLDLVIRGADKIKQTEIYRYQQERLDHVLRTGGEEGLRAEIADLYRRGRLLDQVLRPERLSGPLAEPLGRLHAWGGQTSYALVLHLLDLLDRKETTPDQVVTALGYVESFLVRRMIRDKSTNNLNRIFNAAPKELETDRPIAEAVHRYLSGERRYWPSDEALQDAIRHRPFYWSGRSSQRFFVLRRLEESFEAKEPVDFAKAKLTIEHVMPQTPTKPWLDQLAEEVTDEGSAEELHALLLHTLGNLTLTAENAKLSNHPFDRKQQILDNSALQMNRQIAETPQWGKEQILARADDLAARAVRLWPAPLPNAKALVDDRREWAQLRAALTVLPAGSWTTYGELAELIGTHPRAVGGYIANRTDVPNAYRALSANGTVAPNFHWLDGRTDDPIDVLKAEGVHFDSKNRADQSQRLYAADLADLLGMDLPQTGVPPLTKESNNEERALRFQALLRENQNISTAGYVEDLLKIWRRLGGTLSYGTGTDTSCYPLVWDETSMPGHNLWPMVFYPLSGKVEIVFQHLGSRPPFDNLNLRRELLTRLNTIDGVQLAEVKLDMRPSFSMDLLVGHGATTMGSILEWFYGCAQSWLLNESGLLPLPNEKD